MPAGIWCLYDGAEHRTYTYSREGFLLSETDQNGGKTVLSYTDGVLSEIHIALGARVSLETEGAALQVPPTAWEESSSTAMREISLWRWCS